MRLALIGHVYFSHGSSVHRSGQCGWILGGSLRRVTVIPPLVGSIVVRLPGVGSVNVDVRRDPD